MSVIDDTTTESDSTSTPDGAGNENDAAPKRRSAWRYVKWAAIAIAAAIALMYAAIFFYANVLNDAPDELDTNDLSAALVDDDDPATASDAPTDESAPDQIIEQVETAPEPVDAITVGADGVWTPTDASEFGYRVDEVLSGVNVTAVGRSSQITGELTVDGSTADIDVTVQVADITSDNGSRDGQFRGRIMNAEEFPTANFVTTSPIEFGELPADGEQVTVTATGDLTLRGVTRPVTFDVTAELATVDTGDRIGVLGSIPIIFDDYGIPEPSIGSVSVEDNGLIEFVLVFER